MTLGGEGPSAEHWFGTTVGGNDLFAMMSEAVWTSMEIGLVVGIATVIISAIYGCVMAYFGGWIDRVMLFLLETMIMVPSLLILAISSTVRSVSRFRRPFPRGLCSPLC